MRIILGILMCVGVALGGDGDKEALLKQMDARAGHYGDVSRKIWEFAEVGYKEQKSAELLKSELRQAGFTVQDNVAEIPTAFTASWGQGKPVIAVLGEYDALPGLSQEAIPERKPIVDGAPGHGCGHNLLLLVTVFCHLQHSVTTRGTPRVEGANAGVTALRRCYPAGDTLPRHEPSTGGRHHRKGASG